MTCRKRDIANVYDPEHDLQLLRRQLQGEEVDASHVCTACRRLTRYYKRVAYCILRAWHVNDAEGESGDVVQSWFIQVLTSRLDRCYRCSAIAPFAYRIFQRCCIAAMKRSGRLCQLPSGFDPSIEKMNWLDAYEDTEELSRLRQAIGSLPVNQERAIIHWLQLKEGGRSDKIDGLADKRYSNFLFRARKSLKAALLTDAKLLKPAIKSSRFCK